MLVRLLLCSTVIFTVKAFDFKNVLFNNPELRKCVPTIEMFDASGKLPSGILAANLADLGNFDQCLKIDKINNKSEVIKGQFCTIKITVPLSLLTQQAKMKSFYKLFGYDFVDVLESDHLSPKIEERIIVQANGGFGLVLGLCVPHTCSIFGLSSALTNITANIDPEIKVSPVMGGMCQTKEDLVIEYDTNSIIFITFLCATLFLMIISTLYDMYIQHHKKKPAHIILVAFSVKTNGRKLLAVNNHPDQLPCLNGIRVISIMWVILCHRYSSLMSQPLLNAIVIKDWMNDPINMYIENGFVAVDTFFVLSGLLIGYGYCKAMDKSVKFNIILYYLHRYLRLTPVLAVLIWAHTTIIDSFGSGPFWKFALQLYKNKCIDTWWPSLLYIQNYYNDSGMCLDHTWYLAIDMQLFILSPIILIPLWRWPKQTMIASVVLVLGSIASGFAVSYVYELPISTVLQQNANTEDYMPKYYYATHVRYGPWLIGLMLGYHLFKLKKNKHNRITLHPSQIAFGWIVSLGLLTSTLFTAYDVAVNTDTILGNSFYNGFHKQGWALGVCWVIYACTEGYGGPINTFLSWSLFQVLGRFTYCIYLVHFSLQYFLIASNRTHFYFTGFNMMNTFISDFVVSLIISVGLTLAYESPMVTIEKVLFKTGNKPKKPE